MGLRIRISTPVAAPVAQVAAGFDETLFRALAPPFPRLRVERFDGSHPADEVHLVLDFLLFRQRWVSVITERRETAEEIVFVDEGRMLPFFLKSWTHRHGMQRLPQGSCIVDDILFDTPSWLPAWLLWPAMWAQFAARGPVYRRLFGAPPQT